MTKYLAIAFLITGFLVGDAYGEENAAKEKTILEELEGVAKGYPSGSREKIPWSEQKVKELGLPVIKVGNVTMCEGVESVGFDWENGEYISRKFKTGKQLYKKVEPNQYCFGWKELTAQEKLGYIYPPITYDPFDPPSKLFVMREGCYSNYIFGEEPGITSALCTERYKQEHEKSWETTISCDTFSTRKGDISFSTNGLFLRFQTNPNLSQTDKRKFSLLIEWGKCATLLSP
jgi:hypothetical protein